MELARVSYWLEQSDRRKLILSIFNQPLTATHVARRSGIGRDSCLHHVWSLTLRKLLRCLNRETNFNRLYAPTNLGRACQRRLCRLRGREPISFHEPDISWNLYSSVCYSHRSAVIQSMREPMQAAVIKRKALFQNPQLRMSANNVRDVLWWLLKGDIVRKIQIERRSHPRYELTELGKEFQELLFGARTC